MTRGGRVGLLGTMATLVASAAGWAYGHDQRQRDARAEAEAMTGGVLARGRSAIRLRGCGSCHSIPDVGGATSTVGPPLDDFGVRLSIAGLLPNTTPNLIRWIQHPQTIHPGTLMPDMGIYEQEARDIAAYLYALR